MASRASPTASRRWRGTDRATCPRGAPSAAPRSHSTTHRWSHRRDGSHRLGSDRLLPEQLQRLLDGRCRRSPRATSGRSGSGCWSPRAQPPARSRSLWNGTVLRQVSLDHLDHDQEVPGPGRPVHLRPDRHPSSQGRLVGQTGRDRRRRSVHGLRSYVGRGSVTSVAERPHPKGQRRLDRPLRCARPGSGALRSVSTPRGNRSTSLPHSRLGPLAERPHPYRTASRNDI